MSTGLFYIAIFTAGAIVCCAAADLIEFFGGWRRRG